MSAWVNKYGPWAVVTGASEGIGRALAEEVAARGLHVLLVARREEALQALGAELRGRYGVETEVLALDLARPEAVETLLARSSSREAGLLVACAGFGSSGAFLEGEVGTELEMLDVNCRAVLALSHAFGRRFAAQGRGGLILMSSIVAFQGVPFSANYAATKAYIQSLAEALHLELAPLGVDVLAAAPGPIHSGFAARAGMKMGTALAPRDVAGATLRALGRRMTVRPGWLSKALELALQVPRWARVRIMRLVMGGMIKHRALPARGA